MIKFGFIGCGKISEFHADVVTALQHNIVGVSARKGSINIGKFAKHYNVKNLYYDWREMVKEQEPDALIVAVSWDQTEKVIQEIINFGIPCLVEKPVALSSHALQEIINHTKQFQDRVMVAYNRRFYEFVPRVKEAIEGKELVSVELNFPETTNRLIELKSLEIADHILVYMSSHWLDLLFFLIGELKVECMVKRMNRQVGYIEAYNGILRSLQYDIPIHLQANFNAPSNTSITFNFHDSIYKLCPIEILTIYKGISLVEPSTENPIRRYVPSIDSTFSVETTYKPGFFNQMKHFIETCVQRTGQTMRGCTLSDSLEVTRLCEEITLFN